MDIQDYLYDPNFSYALAENDDFSKNLIEMFKTFYEKYLSDEKTCNLIPLYFVLSTLDNFFYHTKMCKNSKKFHIEFLQILVEKYFESIHFTNDSFQDSDFERLENFATLAFDKSVIFEMILSCIFCLIEEKPYFHNKKFSRNLNDRIMKFIENYPVENERYTLIVGMLMILCMLYDEETGVKILINMPMFLYLIEYLKYNVDFIDEEDMESEKNFKSSLICVNTQITHPLRRREVLDMMFYERSYFLRFRDLMRQYFPYENHNFI